MTARGTCTPYEPLRPSWSREATGEASPSWARFVATETIGSPVRLAAYFATSSVRQLERGPERSAFHGVEPRILEGRPNHGHDLFSLPGSDNDGDVAVRGDPAIGEQPP